MWACGCAGDGGFGVVGAREVWVRAWFGAVRCGRCDLVRAGARRDEWFGLERGLTLTRG